MLSLSFLCCFLLPQAGSRAELATEEYVAMATVLEGAVIVKKKEVVVAGAEDVPMTAE